MILYCGAGKCLVEIVAAFCREWHGGAHLRIIAWQRDTLLLCQRGQFFICGSVVIYQVLRKSFDGWTGAALQAHLAHVNLHHSAFCSVLDERLILLAQVLRGHERETA